MAEARYVNYLSGLDIAPTPEQAIFYLMAVNDDAKVFNDEMNYQGDSSLQGFAHHSDRRQAAPQVPVNTEVGGFGSTVDGNIAWIMANCDDPRSDGGKFIHPNRRNSGDSNYPPQVGG